MCTVTLLSASVSISGYAAENSIVDYDYRFDEGIPAPIKTEQLKISDWDGKAKLKKNTCYFVENSITVSKTFTLPESSMLIIKNNACLKLAKNGKLLVSGTLAIHEGAKINVRSGGSLIVKSTSVGVVNGTLAVSSGGYTGVYGYLQCSGDINLKGKLYILKQGTVSCEQAINVKSRGAKLKGEPDLMLLDERPRYMINELTAANDPKNSVWLYSFLTGNGEFVADKDDKKALVRGFESVLYEYAGEVDMPDKYIPEEYNMDLQLKLVAQIVNTQTEDEIARYGVSFWNGTFFSTYDSIDDVKGYCYSVIKGRPDEKIFAGLD